MFLKTGWPALEFNETEFKFSWNVSSTVMDFFKNYECFSYSSLNLESIVLSPVNAISGIKLKSLLF